MVPREKRDIKEKLNRFFFIFAFIGGENPEIIEVFILPIFGYLLQICGTRLSR